MKDSRLKKIDSRLKKIDIEDERKNPFITL